MEVITRKEALQQGLTHYFTGKPCKNGHLAAKYTNNRLCLDCLAASRPKSLAARKADGRYQDQIDRQNAKDKKRRASEPEYVALRTAACLKWRNANAGKVRQWCKDVRYANPQYIVKNRLASRVNTVIRSGGGVHSSTFEAAVGCSGNDFCSWVESQFLPGMTWNDKGAWHLDHIRPCKSFDLSNSAQQQVCFNWRNYRPIPGADNLKKKDKWTPEMEAEWIQRMTKLGWEGELFLVFSQEVAA